MAEEWVSPSRYVELYKEWMSQTNSVMPNALQAVLIQTSALSALEEKTLLWAEEYTQNWDLPGWVLDRGVQIEGAVDQEVLLARMVLHHPQPQSLMGGNVYGKNGGAQSVMSVSPVGGDRFAQQRMRDGVFSCSDIPSSQGGVLVLWKSWSLDDLESMALEIRWEPPEEFDLQKEE